jgi:hypothetical protein
MAVGLLDIRQRSRIVAEQVLAIPFRSQVSVAYGRAKIIGGGDFPSYLHQLRLPLYGMPRPVRQKLQYLQAGCAAVVLPEKRLLFLIESVDAAPAGHGFPEVGNVQARAYGIQPVNRQAYPVGRDGLDRYAVDEQAKRPLPLV